MRYISSMNLWNRQSLPRKLYIIFGFMAFVVFLELLTLRYSLGNLAAVRAFVYGESVWSKAQKDSAYFLKRFAITRDPADFEAYRKALFIPLECRKARLELQRDNPDMEIVRRGFINGKIAPSDVDSILHLIRRFAWLEHIEIALTTWREADEILQEFEKVAYNYREEILSPTYNQTNVSKLALRLDELNHELGLAEDRFSSALQNGAHWLENVLLISLICIVIIVEFLGFLLIFFFGHSLSNSLNRLNEMALAIGRGEKFSPIEVTTADEVGALTNSINHMGVTIQAAKSELELKIEDRTRELREAVRTRDEFYGIASHELKTPVTAIQLSLQILERKLTNSEREIEKDTVLQHVRHSIDLSRRLTTLQDTLMDVTKISAGLLRVSEGEEDLIAIVRRSIQEVSFTESKDQINFIGPEKLIATFDSVRMGQVFTNLLKNALRYGEGKPVDLEVKKVKSDVQILIRDRGRGVPENFIEKIFEPFVRANADAGISGFGMGLYIARKIMEAHGGSLTIAETGPQGTTFLAKFPC